MGGVAQMIRDGGAVIVILLVLSLFSLTLILWKMIDLWPVTSGRARRDQALADWAAGRRDEALTAVRTGNAPADRVTAYAMQSLAEGLRGPLLDAELQRRGHEEMSAMQRFIRPLELIAMISPLLGLLGTVLGMIQSFQQLAAAEGSANASVLAGGIWQALLTTAAGLIVAIPAAVAASLLSSRIDQAGQRIESSVGRLMLIEGQGAGSGGKAA
jgi:biopolymer transport protein ExbB